MRLHHPLTLALRHLTPSRTIDGAAALPVWLGASGRLDLPGLAARLRGDVRRRPDARGQPLRRIGRSARSRAAHGCSRDRRRRRARAPLHRRHPADRGRRPAGRALRARRGRGGPTRRHAAPAAHPRAGRARRRRARPLVAAGDRRPSRRAGDRDGGRVRCAGPALRRRRRHPHPRHRQPRRAGPRVARSRRRMGPRRSARHRPARLPHLQRPRARPRHGGLRQRLPARHRRLRARGLRRPRSGLAAGRTGRLRAERRAAGARHAALPRPDRRRPSWRAAMAAGARPDRATPRPRPASSCARRATWRSTARSTPGSNPCSPRPTPPTWRPAPQRPPPLDRDETACPNRCPIHA